MERIRRQAEEEHAAATAAGQPHAFDPDMPWDYCFKVAALDTAFWDEELVRAWLAEGWARWSAARPAWFTQKWRGRLPQKLLPPGAA